MNDRELMDQARRYREAVRVFDFHDRVDVGYTQTADEILAELRRVLGIDDMRAIVGDK